MAGRRWGPGVSGWLVGFPLTSGPVAFFLALDQGVSFAAGAAVAGFAHHLEGPGPAIRVLRGLLLGLFAFAGFFFVLVLSIERAGIAQAFAAATAAALILQAGALWAMRRESPQAGSGRA